MIARVMFVVFTESRNIINGLNVIFVKTLVGKVLGNETSVSADGSEGNSLPLGANGRGRDRRSQGPFRLMFVDTCIGSGGQEGDKDGKWTDEIHV